MRFARVLSVLLALGIAAPAGAVVTTKVSAANKNVLEIRETSSTVKLNILENALSNANSTVVIRLDGEWAKLRVFTFVTYVASTYVTMKVECSLDGTNYGVVQTRAIAAGTATLSDLSDKKTLGAADKDFMTEYDVTGCLVARLTLGGDNTDVASVQAIAVK